MKIFFTGLKHSGKTTFARMYAERHSLLWADSDDLILERISPLTVREYFRSEGKDAFMALEKETSCAFIESKDDFSLSFGGGAADNLPLMQLAKENGFIVYLTRAEDILLERIILKNGIPPFLDKDDPKGSFHVIYERRDAVYRKYASLVIDLGPYGDKEETYQLIESRIQEALR